MEYVEKIADKISEITISGSGPHHTPQFIIDDSAFNTVIYAFCNLVFDYMELHKK